MPYSPVRLAPERHALGGPLQCCRTRKCLSSLGQRTPALGLLSSHLGEDGANQASVVAGVLPAVRNEARHRLMV